MCFHGQDLAVDSEAANVISRAVSECRQQRICILKTQATQLCQSIQTIHSTNCRGRCRHEFDGLLLKHATETQPNHDLPQFIIVIDNCSTVASETHMK